MSSRLNPEDPQINSPSSENESSTVSDTQDDSISQFALNHDIHSNVTNPRDRKVKLIKFALHQVKCLVISFCITISLVTLFSLCFYIWVKKHTCQVHEKRVKAFHDMHIQSKEMWPTGTDPLGNTYGDSEEDRKAIFDNLKVLKDNLDHIFLLQSWKNNVKVRSELKSKNTCNGARLTLFDIFGGPWDLESGDRLLDVKNINVPSKQPPGAGFYPEDITKEEFEEWMQTLSEEDQQKAKGFYHIIERNSDGDLKLTPYSEAYKKNFKKAAEALRNIADVFGDNNVPMRDFLKLKADAFENNNFKDGDIKWMQLDENLLVDFTLGPFRTEMDKLYGYKATIEAYASVKDPEATDQVQELREQLSFIQSQMPMDDRFKDPHLLGDTNSLFVNNLIYEAGGAAYGIQLNGYNLPVDTNVQLEYGSKRMVFYNMLKKKYETIMEPLQKRLLLERQFIFPSIDAYFYQILSHELMHSVGPHDITDVDGKNTTVREALKDLHDTIEECKSEVGSLFMLHQLISHQKVDLVFAFRKELEEQVGINPTEKLRRSMYVTYLSSIFRSARFGSTNAHGKAVVMVFNYLQEAGGFVAVKQKVEHGKPVYSHEVNFSFIDDAVESLLSKVLSIQAEGDYEKAEQFVSQYGSKSSIMERTLDVLGNESELPIDVRPKFE